MTETAADTAAEVQQLRAQLAQLRAAQEEFLRAVSHDLRAPLRHITSYGPLVTEVLQEADGAKANHLAYLGDATVGERVNYGAGSITANYDGANKHRTVIEADAHIGSNCVLVAPVTIGAGGTVGGGSTITKSTPPGALSVARGKQVSIANWSRPAKQPKP